MASQADLPGHAEQQVHFTAADLAKYLPGVDREELFAETATTPGSSLGFKLHATLIGGSEFPLLTDSQFAALAILRSKSRTLTYTQILVVMSKWPQFRRYSDIAALAGMIHISNQEITDNGLADNMAVRKLRSTARFLMVEARRYPTDTKFPPPGYMAPQDPVAFAAWKEAMTAEAREQEADPEGEIWYDYDDYWGGDWCENFEEELDMRETEGRGPPPTYRLQDLAEDEIFAGDIPKTAPNGSNTTEPRFNLGGLPKELRDMILEFAFTFPEPLKIIASSRRIAADQPSNTTEEDSSNIRYKFSIVAKVPKALIPSNTPHKISEFGQHYWKLSDPIHLLAAHGVNKEFDTVITKAFYSRNTFELHDRTASLRVVGSGRNFMGGEHARIVAHRSLELQSKLGNMAHIRSLNIDISINPFNGQYKWDVRRTFLAIAAIPDLRRLIITTNMYGFISDGPGPEYQDWDYHFWRDDTTPYPLEWCGVRMVSWAASKKLKLYLPQYRAVEHVFKELMEMKDGDPYKFWIEDDWEEPINGFAALEIAKARFQDDQERFADWLYPCGTDERDDNLGDWREGDDPRERHAKSDIYQRYLADPAGGGRKNIGD
jgi:hypothetical protein